MKVTVIAGISLLAFSTILYPSSLRLHPSAFILPPSSFILHPSPFTLLTSNPMLPIWLKVIYTLFVCLLIPVYWKQYGPANFLWFCDIALFLTVPALWLESSLLASMMLVSIALVEVAWNTDFLGRLLTGQNVFGLSNYMFDAKIPLPIRALSLFHVFLVPLLLWMVYQLGYDGRAVIAQTVLAWLVLPLSYFLAKPSENVNWVRGLRGKPQRRVSGPVFLLLVMLAYPLVLYLPAHIVLKTVMRLL